MAIRKVGGSWEVHRVVRKRVPSRKDAEAFSRLLESAVAEAARKHEFSIKPCCVIRDKLDEFLSDSELGLRRRPCGGDTLALHKKRLLAFDRAFHSRPIDAISLEDLEGWIRRRAKTRGRTGRIKADTVNADLVSLRAFGRWAMAKGYAPAALPFMAVGKLRAKGKVGGFNQRPPKALEMGELLAVIERIAAEREDVGLLLKGMALFCLRPRALCLLRRVDLKLPKGGHPGSLTCAGLKGGHERQLPIVPGSEQHTWAKSCIALFRRVRNRSPKGHEPLLFNLTGRRGASGRGWNTAGFDRVLSHVCSKLEIAFTAYQARHSVISWLQKTPGMSAAATQAAAAHSNVNTQNIYGRRHARDAVPAFIALSDLVAKHRKTVSHGEARGGDVPG